MKQGTKSRVRQRPIADFQLEGWRYVYRHRYCGNCPRCVSRPDSWMGHGPYWYRSNASLGIRNQYLGSTLPDSYLQVSERRQAMLAIIRDHIRLLESDLSLLRRLYNADVLERSQKLRLDELGYTGCMLPADND